MVSQSQQTAEFLRPFRQPLRPNTDHRGAVMGHRGHTHLHRGPLRSFVAKLASPTAEQTGNMTSHRWPAVPTGTGQLHLVGGAFAVQARRIEQLEHLVRRRGGVDRLKRVWDANCENTPRMERLADRGVVDAEVACDGMDGQTVLGENALDSLWDFIDQGYHIAGVVGVPHWGTRGEDKTCRGLRDNPGLAPKLGGAIALAFDNGGDGRIVRVDDFTVAELLALGEPSRLFDNVVMGVTGLLQRCVQALASDLTKMHGALQARLSGLCQSGDRRPESEQARFRVTYQTQEHLALATTLAAKTAPDLLEVVMETSGLAL